MEPIEFELNKAKIKVFENGDIWKWVEFKHVKKWIQSKGCIQTQKKSGYCRHQTEINEKAYTTSRIIYKAFNLDWNMNDTSPDNTIDHIDRNSLNNHISNLRVANMVVQNVNRDCIINAKGYFLRENGKWRAQINTNRKKMSLGCFDTEEEARKAYLFAVSNRY